MKILGRILSAMLLLTIIAAEPSNLSAQAAEAGDGKSSEVTTPHLTVGLVSSSHEIARGGSASIGLSFHLQDHWHIYWVNAGDAGAPPRVKWELPPDLSAGPLLFPAPSRLAQGPLMDFGYEDQVIFPINITAGLSAKDRPARLDAHVQWLVCREVCIPGKAHLGLELKIVPHAHGSALSGVVEQTIKNLPKAIPPDLRVSVLGGEHELVIAVRTDHRLDKVEFYPFAKDLIANAAPQLVEATADGFRLHVPRASDPKRLPTRLNGILKFPGQNAFELDSEVVPGEVPISAATPVGTAGTLSVLSAIGLAFCGGLILNLMPCVSGAVPQRPRADSIIPRRAFAKALTE